MQYIIVLVIISHCVLPTMADCPLGDRSVTCATITAIDCYDTDIEEECCDTCSSLQNHRLGNDCLYGDKNSAW